MGLITTRRRKVSALAVSLAITSSTIAGLVVLGSGAQADTPNALATTAQETAEVLTGMRFLEQATAAAPVAESAVNIDGVVDLTVPETVVTDPRVGWFRATYADKKHHLAELVSDELDIPVDEIVAAWSSADDVRMRVIYAAMSHIGDPYVWNSAGPDAFDCSGLVMASWTSVGIELPHFSMAQANSGEAVSALTVKPGDLVHAPGHIMMSLGVRDAVVESTRGGVQVSHWGTRGDAFTDPLQPRTVSWTVPDGVRRTPDGRIAKGGEGSDEPTAPTATSVPAPVTVPAPTATSVPEPAASTPASPTTVAPTVPTTRTVPGAPTTVA
jgi:hypothetical protein